MIDSKASVNVGKDPGIYNPNLILVMLGSFSLIWVALFIAGMGKLAYFFSFMVMATTLVPLPTPPVILYIGKIYSPLIIAIVGGIASSLGCLLDYIIIGRASDTKYFSKYKQSKFIIKSKQYFKTNGFMTLMFFALTPFPFEPVKVLAILSNYNVILYAVAISISRGLRYYIVASMGILFSINQIIGITALFVAASVIKLKTKS